MPEEIKNNDEVIDSKTNEVTSDDGIKELKDAVIEEAKLRQEVTEAKETLDNATPEEKKEIEAELGKVNSDSTELKSDAEKLVSDSEVKDDSTSKDKESKISTDLEKMNLPGRLIQAAYRNHLTDEEIVNLGDRAVPVLSKLANTLDGASQALGEAGRKYKELLKSQTKKEDKKSTPVKFSKEEIEENPVLGKVQELLETNQKEIEDLKTSLKEKDITASKQIAAQQQVQINTFFDDVSDSFPELGNSKALTKVEMVLRNSILEDADDIIIGATLNGTEKSLDEALGEALSIYEGKNPRKTEKIRQEIVDDVKKREGQHIHRPSTKKAKENLLTPHDKAVSVAAKFLRDRGRDVL